MEQNKKKTSNSHAAIIICGIQWIHISFASFPVHNTNASNINSFFWDSVKLLGYFDIKICFVSIDGAQNNRDFMNLNFFNKNKVDEKYTCKNMFFPQFPNIQFIMDIKHVKKKE